MRRLEHVCIINKVLKICNVFWGGADRGAHLMFPNLSTVVIRQWNDVQHWRQRQCSGAGGRNERDRQSVLSPWQLKGSGGL